MRSNKFNGPLSPPVTPPMSRPGQRAGDRFPEYQKLMSSAGTTDRGYATMRHFESSSLYTDTSIGHDQASRCTQPTSGLSGGYGDSSEVQKTAVDAAALPQIPQHSGGYHSITYAGENTSQETAAAIELGPSAVPVISSSLPVSPKTIPSKPGATQTGSVDTSGQALEEGDEEESNDDGVALTTEEIRRQKRKMKRFR